MTYTGDVTPGGPSDVRELDRLTIRKAAVDEQTHNNVYLLTCRASGEQLLIDAAADLPRVRALVEEGTGRVDALVTTHRHWDHTRALQGAVDTWSPRTYAGAADADDIPVAPHVRLEDGDEVRFGEVTLIVRHVRGHTPGSVVLAYADERDGTHLFTGDTLFPGGVGATTAFPYQSFEQLYADVTERVFAPHPDSAWFYPGHGADSTLGAERPHLDEWRERGW